MKRRKTTKSQQASKEASSAPPPVKIKKSSNEIVKTDSSTKDGDDEEMTLIELIKDPSVFIDKFNHHYEGIKKSMLAIKEIKLNSSEECVSPFFIRCLALRSVVVELELNDD